MTVSVVVVTGCRSGRKEFGVADRLRRQIADAVGTILRPARGGQDSIPLQDVSPRRRADDQRVDVVLAHHKNWRRSRRRRRNQRL